MIHIKKCQILMGTFVLVAIGVLVFSYLQADQTTQTTVPIDADTEAPVSLSSLKAGDEIYSPLYITGDARGYWFFEASFPVVLVDWDGRIIAEGYVQAQQDWMTEEYVAFEGTLEFESPYDEGDPDFMKNGVIILQKDNPSGLPEHDDAVEIPIVFQAK